MIIISHRANLDGKNTASFKENHPNSIRHCISEGFDVEIDLWYEDGHYILGHDKPEYEINYAFLEDNVDNLWVHTKNAKTLQNLVERNSKLNYFTHNNDDAVLTSKCWIWTFPYKQIYSERSVTLSFDPNDLDHISTIPDSGAVCTDHPILYNKVLNRLK